MNSKDWPIRPLLRVALSEWLLGVALDVSTGDEQMHLALALKYYFSKVQIDDLVRR